MPNAKFMNNQKNLIVIAAVIFAAGLLIGFVGRGFISGTFDDGWQAAKNKLTSRTQVSSWMVTQLNGTVKEKTDDSLVIITGLLSPLADPALQERLIKVEPDTVISLSRPKTALELYGEVAGQIIALETALQDAALSSEQRSEAMRSLQSLKNELTKKKLTEIKALREQLDGLSSEQVEAKAALQQQITARLAVDVEAGLNFSDIAVGDLIKVTAASDIAQAKKITPTAIIVRQR